MARLTIGMREDIVQRLLVPIREEMKEVLKEIVIKCDEEFEKTTPEDVKQIIIKYPGLVGDNRSTYVGSYGIMVSYMEFKKYIHYFHANVIGKLFKREDIAIIVKEYNDYENEIKKMRNQLTCALAHINTSNQLKDQFPEAYEAYLTLEGRTTVDKNTPCDTIEKVRAEMNSLTKKKEKK